MESLVLYSYIDSTLAYCAMFDASVLICSTAEMDRNSTLIASHLN